MDRQGRAVGSITRAGADGPGGLMWGPGLWAGWGEPWGSEEGLVVGASCISL